MTAGPAPETQAAEPDAAGFPWARTTRQTTHTRPSLLAPRLRERDRQQVSGLRRGFPAAFPARVRQQVAEAERPGSGTRECHSCQKESPGRTTPEGGIQMRNSVLATAGILTAIVLSVSGGSGDLTSSTSGSQIGSEPAAHLLLHDGTSVAAFVSDSGEGPNIAPAVPTSGEGPNVALVSDGEGPNVVPVSDGEGPNVAPVSDGEGPNVVPVSDGEGPNV